jgi:hypothetical protein
MLPPLLSLSYWRKGALILLHALLLASCSFNTTTTAWQSDQVDSPVSQSILSQKWIDIGPQFLPVEVEVTDGPQGRYVYLNGKNRFFAKAGIDSEGYDVTDVELAVDGETHKFLAKRLAGGQRLLVPQQTADQLLQALDTGASIVIAIPN